MTSRLFVSLDIPEFVRDEIDLIRKEVYGVGAEKIKWEEVEKLHVTLKFLGDVEDSRQSKILESLQHAVAKFSKLSLELDKFDIFERNGIPSILWLGLKDNSELNSLFAGIENQLAKHNFKKEKRKFHPHITVLRLRGSENQFQIANFRDYQLENANFTSNSVSLVQSVLRPAGSVYKIIKSFYMI